MFLSVFDIFKIGVGPSSSHTMGPMSAAARFLNELASSDRPRATGAKPVALKASLHGSLAYTGIGHRSGEAVILGLNGYLPATIDPDLMEPTIARVQAEGMVRPQGHPAYRFRPATDLVFDKTTPLDGHPNGMRFTALDQSGQTVYTQAYFSVGGGFVLSDDELKSGASREVEGGEVPYPFHNGSSMLSMARTSGLSIAQMKRRNEEVFVRSPELDRRMDDVWQAMSSSIMRGLETGGHVSGQFGIKRRAAAIHSQLMAASRDNMPSPLMANDWLCLYAIAVNEENANGGRVVTAPTNGAAGVIPAVLKYALEFMPGTGRSQVHEFLLTAAAVGGIIKRNASISGAEVGCQGEVGSASAMAAAGLCAVMGGTPEQVENAAEIALEHHLGMTCDPVAGLVQIPCIERNAFGAVKAVTAASLALRGDGIHVVSLDACVETMRQTGHDMSHRYKETSLAGLAANVTVC